MSLIKAVTAAIARRGSGTANDIHPEFPDVTLEQVRRALVNACRMGQLQPIRRGVGLGRAKGRTPTTYGPLLAHVPPFNCRLPVNSVWSLAA